MAKDTNTILLFGAAGVAFFGYKQGWFDGMIASFSGTAKAPALTAAQLAASKAAPGGSSAPPPAAPAVPALGVTVKSLSDVTAQAAAHDPYILPDAATFAPFATTPLAGYSAFSLTDYPNVLLRQDVSALANSTVSSSGTPLSLSDLQALMKTKGLSGLGDYQRHIAARTGRARPVRFA